MNPIDFGDFVSIEQKRYGTKNEMYCHKVIGSLESNCWVDVPVQLPRTEKIHPTCEKVLACICCGVEEREVYYYKLADVQIEKCRERCK